MLTRNIHTQIDDQGKDHSHPKWARKNNRPNNCSPIMCLPMMWKILSVQIRGDLLLVYKPRTVPRGTERMSQVDLRNSRTTIKVAFLDCPVYIYKDGHLQTTQHTKRNNIRNYFHYRSFHSKHLKDSLPYIQAIILRKIYIDNNELKRKSD